MAVAFTLTWIFCCQFGFTQQFPFDAVGPVLQVVQTIALDSGLLHGPANTILAAQRAVEAGALALKCGCGAGSRRAGETGRCEMWGCAQNPPSNVRSFENVTVF